jgi:hypothetical protein
MLVLSGGNRKIFGSKELHLITPMSCEMPRKTNLRKAIRYIALQDLEVDHRAPNPSPSALFLTFAQFLTFCPYGYLSSGTYESSPQN